MNKATCPIVPMKGMIVVTRKQTEVKTKSGLYLDIKQDDTETQGIVEAVGSDVTDVGVGNTVVLREFLTQVNLDKIEYYLVRAEKVMAVVK